MRKSRQNRELRDSEALRQAPSRKPWWRWMRRFSLPAWVVSVLLHAALFSVLTMTLRFAPAGTGAEPNRVVGLVLKHHTPEGDFYESEQDQAQSMTQTRSLSQLQEAIDDTPPVDPSDALPEAAEIIGPAALDESLRPGVGELTGRPRQGASLGSSKARTKVFGVEGEGFKFVYVFDRSGSMGGSGRSALKAAKAELLASLESLGETHQFQIIFYNEEPTIFPLAGQRGRLVFGNRANRERARRFVASITADGATRHEKALIAALRLWPDVIFFLTDADEPALTSAQLKRITRLNGGRASIHSIEFGLGPRISETNFLVELARQNGGRYVYVDISKLGRNPAAGR